MEQEEFDDNWTVPEQYIINSGELVLKEVIGSGAEGKVYSGTWSNIAVAVKEITAPEDSDDTTGGDKVSSEAALHKAQVLLKRHVACMTNLNHPNLVRFCGVCLDPPLLVMEYYHHGSMYNLLEKARRQWIHSLTDTGAEAKDDKWSKKYMNYLDWDRRLAKLHDIVAGMIYLHKRHYVHGDLRSPNLLIGQDGGVRIGDFGFARRLQGSASSMKVEKLTHPRWVAPELMFKGRLSPQSDVYSFGIIMYEMLTWQLPFHDLDKEQVVLEVLAGKRPVVPAEAELPPGTGSHTFLWRYIKLMQECWAQDPLQRPDFKRIASRLKAWIRWRLVLKDLKKKFKTPVIRTDVSKAEQGAPAAAAAAAGSSQQAEQTKATAAEAKAVTAAHVDTEHLIHSQAPVREVAPAAISVPMLEMYDLDLKEVPVGSKSCRLYHGTWFEAEVTVLEYRPETTLQTVRKDHLGPSQAAAPALERLQDKLLAAVRQLSSLSHPNIIRICGYCLQPPVLVTEYQRHGTVHSLLQRAQRQLKSSSSTLHSGRESKLAQYLRWKRRLQMLQEALSGLLFLQSQGYLLGQLSSNDMFVGVDGKVRLGMCGPLKGAGSESAEEVNILQPRWTAPEVLEQKTQTAASDVYSFGIVMYEMLTFQLPFQDLQEDAEVTRFVMKGGRPTIPSAAELPPGTAAAAGLEQYLLLMQQCWEQDPDCRPPLQQLAQGLKTLSTAGKVQSSTGKSLLMLPMATQKPLLDAEDNPPQAVELPTIGEEDFSPPGTPPPSCGVSSLGFQSQYLQSLFRRGPEEAARQQLQAAASSDSEVSTSSQPAVQLQPGQPAAAAAEETQAQGTAQAAKAPATAGAAADQQPPAASGSSLPRLAVPSRQLEAPEIQYRSPSQAVAADAAAIRKDSAGRIAEVLGSASEEVQQEPPVFEDSQLADSAVLITGHAPGPVAAPVESNRLQTRQPAAQLTDMSSATGAATIAATEPAVGAAAGSSFQALLIQLEGLQPQLVSSILRLLVLCTTYMANTTLAHVQQQQQQCADSVKLSVTQPQMLRLHERQEQQQQLVTLQLQTILVLLRSTLVQQPAAQGCTLQVAGQLMMLLVGLAGWRQAASASVHGTNNSRSSGGGQSAAKYVVYILPPVCLLSWLVLPQAWFAVMASILVGSFVMWQRFKPNNLRDEVPLSALESQPQLTSPQVPETHSNVNPAAIGCTVYDKRSDIVGVLSVALQPHSSSSSVGYASWSATWQPAGAPLAGAGRLQPQVLHTLPSHRYFCSRQQRRGICTLPARQGAAFDDELVKDQGQAAAETEQLSGHSSHEVAVPGPVMGSQQIADLHHHPVLSSPAKEQPPSSLVLQVLARLMHRQQQQQEEQQQQQEDAQQDEQVAGAMGGGGCPPAGGSAPAPRWRQVLWVCLDPPMLLEGLPAGRTSAAWLLQQQQQPHTFPKHLSDSVSSRDGTWLPPFAAALWPQVLDWLQQVAAALADMHGEGCVYGGVHAGTVYLVEDGTCDKSRPSGAGSSSGGHQAGSVKHQTAALSLVVPWQHAVTPGCMVDGALAPPEVLTGKQHPASSPATDVYGFGMLLWQFATGWVPQQQQQATQVVDDELGVYDELNWCAEMMQAYGTTFPDAAAAASDRDAAASGLEAVQTSYGSAAAGSASDPAVAGATTGADIGQEGGWICRHGSLPSSAQAWLPAGYRQLMHDCCSNAPAYRPSMTVVCQRVGELKTLV